jgi:4-hydroxy-tetrahydrodipicolinate reductase
MTGPDCRTLPTTQDAKRQLRVVLGGVQGRMGQLASAAIEAHTDFSLAGGLTSADDPEQLLQSDVAEIYLDFTVASAARVLAPRAARAGLSPVVGTSGLDQADLSALAEACEQGGVGGIVVPNFSIGAVTQMLAAERAARHLTCDGIIEIHHTDKRDSPSGTALATAQLIAAAAGTEAPEITSQRHENVLAIQSVNFSSPHERLMLSHTVSNRQAYLPGLLLALRRVRNLNGLVIGLDKLLHE